MALSIDQVRGAATPPNAAELERLHAEAPQGSGPVVLAQLSAQYSADGDAVQILWWVGTTAQNVHILEAFLVIAVDENTPAYWNWTSNQEPGATVNDAVFGQSTTIFGLGQLYAGKTLQVALSGTYLQDGNQGNWGPFKTTLAITT